MRVLITGVTGFVGGHLAEALLGRGVEVHGLSRRGIWPADLAHLTGRVALNAADLADRDVVGGVLAAVRPDWVFHLAGYAHAGRSSREPDVAWAGNLEATRNLFEAVARSAGPPRILFVSSGLVYGNADGPCDEETPLRPTSPYAASKAAADRLSRDLSDRLDIVIARPFNHIGPRQSPDYAIPRFASQIAAIELGRQPPVLETGDLEARRDLSDVRDTVRAYILLLEKGRRGQPYNVGTGVAHRIGDVLDRLLAIAGLAAEIRRRPDARPAETGAPRADISKIRRDTGWQPAISLEQTLRDTLDYWRKR